MIHNINIPFYFQFPKKRKWILYVVHLLQVDHLINQNHLFKRSIILIKAWCYYESRLLGAHHGLISTYALETLVLYIFHMFNNSFAGPLEVTKFLLLLFSLSVFFYFEVYLVLHSSSVNFKVLYLYFILKKCFVFILAGSVSLLGVLQQLWLGQLLC